MKLPLTLHPANHLPVQCLLLHAALSSDSAAGRQCQDKKFQKAASIAQLRTRYPWEGRDGPPYIVQLSRCWQDALHPPATVAASSLPGSHAGRPLSQGPPPSELTATRQQRQAQQADAYRALAFTAPARLVALHAPPVLLRQLQSCNHDIVSYDAAVHHASLLTRLLATYGLQVALTGATRRGCPFAAHSEYLICLTEAATHAVEAVDPISGHEEAAATGWGDIGVAMGETAVKAPTRGEPCAAVPTGREKRKKPGTDSGTRLRDALMLDPRTPRAPSPAVTPPVVAREVATGGREATSVTDTNRGPRYQHCAQDRCVKAVRRRRCPWQEALSSTDYFSPPVCYRLRRALDGLIRCGYVVAATSTFPPSPSQLEKRQAIRVTVRYDPHQPTQVPPPACTDPLVLSRLQLHELLLCVCPWHAFVARQLFLTGPAAFTAHVTLRALEHGIDVNMNGAFACWRRPPTREGGGMGSKAPVATVAVSPSETGDATLQPVHGEKQRKHESHGTDDKVEQMILEDEGDLFSLARMPHVDRLLRGLYCQRHLS